ncbi:hypothetical protein NKH18_29680 [Streptomyces sp. M10(2022)]
MRRPLARCSPCPCCSGGSCPPWKPCGPDWNGCGRRAAAAARTGPAGPLLALLAVLALVRPALLLHGVEVGHLLRGARGLSLRNRLSNSAGGGRSPGYLA